MRPAGPPLSSASSRRALAGGSATVTYQHTDALGSPVATTNSAKTVLQRSEYEPYGYLLNRPMQDGPGYTGHVSDAATGLVYMQQRYYDPLIGSMLSRDAVTAYSSGDIRHFNVYAYAYNNPYRFNDPDGRCPDGCVIEAPIAVGAGAIYVGAFALGAAGLCAATCDKIMSGMETAAQKIRDYIRTATADSPASAGEKVREDTKPAVGDSGKKGEREGGGGDKGRNDAWGKIDGKETSPKEGVRVKELEGGGRAETHDSTKSRDYPQGTPTIKIQNDKGEVETIIRYPKEPQQ